MRAGHAAVSRLSPAIRHRLIAEEEVVARVLEDYPFPVAEKFLQEVCWRSHWKGWLQMRPSIWDDYLRGLREWGDSPQGEKARRILDHGSGNAIIDHFLRELKETGYLHNHARMWLAGWWVHQAGLPWQLGASHFLDHLLDADAASNTLSWRWVAGRQTPGKVYLARATNLARYLDVAEIPGGAEALPMFDPPEDLSPPEMETFRRDAGLLDGIAADTPEYSTSALLWIHSEDLSLETWLPDSFEIAGIVSGDGMSTAGARGQWLLNARNDAANRTVRRWKCHVENAGSGDLAEKLVEMAGSLGLRHVVSAFIPIGPLGDQKKRIRSKLAASGIEWHEIHRDWDLRAWPLARAGFFPFWKQISRMLRKAE